jgi:SHS2 domain-containing protein
MSSWLRPTTADIGLRSFAASFERLFEETSYGMQNYLIDSNSAKQIPSLIHHSSVWNVSIPLHEEMNTILLVKWLEEVLYQDEVERKWMVESTVRIKAEENAIHLQAHVLWVSSDSIEKEVEIKAVTRQDLVLMEVKPNEEVLSKWPEVPSFEGPGWFCDVVFDI